MFGRDDLRKKINKEVRSQENSNISLPSNLQYQTWISLLFLLTEHYEEKQTPFHPPHFSIFIFVKITHPSYHIHPSFLPNIV